VNRVALGLAALAATSIAVAGCGSSSSGGGDNPTVSAGDGGGSTTAAASTSKIPGCSPATIKTKHANTLTFGADKPVYEPWYVNNDPTNGKGFEDAVSYAIAKELGYTKSQVAWTRITFNQAISPAPKPFDLDLDEFSITPTRQQHFDFSSPYYNVTQTVVALKGSKAAGVTTLAGLKNLKLGAEIGTTSADAIANDIKPTQSPSLPQSNSIALQQLKNGQIDGIVVDLPTAFYMTSAQLDNGVIVGQIPTTGKPEQFGALLEKDSAVTSCVSKAVTALQSDGTLAKIQDKWLAQVGKAPVLQ
jgi:polar amino acid transport system substrate-binding protein